MGFAYWGESGALWWTWRLGDAMGVILVTPLILSWSNTRCWPCGRRMSVEAVLDGGQLTVQSTEGQGTTFVITLSRDVAEAPTQIALPA